MGRYGPSAAVAAVFLTVMFVSAIESISTQGDGNNLALDPTVSVDASAGDPNASLAGMPASPRRRPPPAVSETSDWELSVFYTVVEEYYAGRVATVTGCGALECSSGSQLLGTFPGDFVTAVMEEGTGRITTPTSDGREYLNWSSSTGFWLDFHPRDARGFVLRPFQSVAAPPDMGFGTTIAITNCGADLLTGEAIDAGVCEHLRSAQWVIRDRFEVAPTGRRLDLYIGEQTGPTFAARNASWFTRHPHLFARWTWMAERRAGWSAVRLSAATPGVAPADLDRPKAPRSAAVEWARSVRLELVAILLVAIVIRLGWVLIGAVPPESDYATFEQMATVIRSGSWWPESYGWVFQGPVYPTLLALVPALGDDGLTGIRLLNTLMQAATVACVYAAARHRFGVRSGLVAAGLSALLPGMWLFTPLLAAENLAMLLVAVISLCLALPRSSLRS